jgi:hypothetical protein
MPPITTRIYTVPYRCPPALPVLHLDHRRPSDFAPELLLWGVLGLGWCPGATASGAVPSARQGVTFRLVCRSTDSRRWAETKRGGCGRRAWGQKQLGTAETCDPLPASRPNKQQERRVAALLPASHTGGSQQTRQRPALHASCGVCSMCSPRLVGPNSPLWTPHRPRCDSHACRIGPWAGPVKLDELHCMGRPLALCISQSGKQKIAALLPPLSTQGSGRRGVHVGVWLSASLESLLMRPSSSRYFSSTLPTILDIQTTISAWRRDKRGNEPGMVLPAPT